MAILRGGRRIGNYDIRIGLPRDRSLDNVNADERLRRKPGGNPESTINRFIAEINKGEGLARPTRYLVYINLPSPIALTNSQVSAGMGFDDASAPSKRDLEMPDQVRNVGMMCNKITMPARDINTVAHQTYGPRREMPYAYSYSGEIDCTFYTDKYNTQRNFWENWQSKISDIGLVHSGFEGSGNTSHHMNYYDNYIGNVYIYQLGSFDNEQDRDRITYAVRLNEVYPETIGSYDLGYADTDTFINIPIKLRYRTWENLTIQDVEGVEFGKPFGDAPTIKAGKDFGLFGGLLSKLPPEVRRAGRDILQTSKRNLPIGRVTGGRVFPPFL